MADEVTEELKDQIVAYLQKRSGRKANFTIRDIVRGVKEQKSLTKKAVTALAKEGRLEFASYGGATFIRLPDAEAS